GDGLIPARAGTKHPRAVQVRGAFCTQRKTGNAGERCLVTQWDLHRRDVVATLDQLQEPADRLARYASTEQQHHPTLIAPEQLGELGDRALPLDCLPATGDCTHRGLDTVTAIHPAVVGAPRVADEVTVDVEIGPRPDADHDVVARVDHHVAALGAPGADRRGLVEVPGA